MFMAGAGATRPLSMFRNEDDMYIIIRGRTSIGKTRSEQEQNLRREDMKTMSDEQLDKLRFLEKKVKEETGSKQNFIGQENISDVK